MKLSSECVTAVQSLKSATIHQLYKKYLGLNINIYDRFTNDG